MAQYYTCFNSTLATLMDVKEWESYALINGVLFDTHEDITDRAIFGQDYECLARLNADLMMLVTFLKFIYAEKVLYASNGIVYEQSYFSDKYCLEKIKDSFYCRGVDPDQLENLFAYWNLGLLPGDGIGFMQLEGTGTVFPVFRVEDL